MNFRDSPHDVVNVFDDVDGADFVKAVVRERQRAIQICNHIRSGGIGIRIYSDRSRSLVEAAT